MSEVFYVTGLLFWGVGALWFMSAIMWGLALKILSNGGELADYAMFCVNKRNRSKDQK